MSNNPDVGNDNPETCEHYFMKKIKHGWYCPSCDSYLEGEE